MARELLELRAQGERVKELREALKAEAILAGQDPEPYTQEGVARRVGVSYRGYQAWEGGTTDIRPENRVKLAKILKSTPGYIEFGPKEPSQLDRIEQKVDRLLACLLTPEQRRGYEELEALAAELEPAPGHQQRRTNRA